MKFAPVAMIPEDPSLASSPMLPSTRPLINRPGYNAGRPMRVERVFLVCIAGAFLVGCVLLAVQDGAKPVASKEKVAYRSSAHEKDCESPSFTKETLKLIHEEPIVRLIRDRGVGRDDLLASFEASAVTHGPGNSFYIVFDNTFAIGRVHSQLVFDTEEPHQNKLLTWPQDVGEESEFEGIAFNETSQTFLVVQETVEAGEEGTLVANVFEVRMGDEEVTVLEDCLTDFEFSSDNKGFEGIAIAYSDKRKMPYLLGMCEGNHCKGGREGRDSGNGRVVVMKKTATSDGICKWVTVQVIPVPKSANFLDYSVLSIRNNSRVLIGSQVSTSHAGCARPLHFQ
eukprot:jgi/Mesvir1/29077/Mv18383-RA.1